MGNPEGISLDLRGSWSPGRVFAGSGKVHRLQNNSRITLLSTKYNDKAEYK